MNDADELDRLEWNEQRLSSDSARGKEIPRAPVPADVGNTERPKGGGGSKMDAGRTPRSTRGGPRGDDVAPLASEPLPEIPQADDIAPATPKPLPGTPQAIDVPVEEDDIPVGYAEDIPDSAVDRPRL